MKRIIKCSTLFPRSGYVKAHKMNIRAKIIDTNRYETIKDQIDYQFKEDGYRFYSKPGTEQYTWIWFAVPYGDRLSSDK